MTDRPLGADAAGRLGRRLRSNVRGTVARQRELLRTPAGRVALGAIGLLALLTVVGLVVLWPDDREADRNTAVVGKTQEAEVVSVTSQGCESFAGPGCRLVGFELMSGPNSGRRSTFSLPGESSVENTPRVSPGDRIRVFRNAPEGIDPALVEQLPIDNPADQPFAFVDFERKEPLLRLALVFALLVLLLGRWQGARSLLGLGLSLAVVLVFLVPAIVDGKSAVLVSLVGALAIMFATIALSHGAGPKSLAAMLGTGGSLLLTALLALLFVDLAHITGLASEEATLARGSSGGRVSLEGLVLAGMVVGALGVLDDVTVSQSSTVMALKRANPLLRFRGLYRRALDVGRDHVGATVNTLVLAYVGAALPVLVIFTTQGTGFSEAINRENVATEVVAMLVGSIGLIAAVPLTTALTALLADRLPAEAIPDEHAHEH